MEMIAKFDERYPKKVAIQIKEMDSSVIQKEISFQDFFSLIENSMEMDNMYTHIGAIPNGYYDGIISTYYENTFAVDIVVPAGVNPVIYMEKIYKIPYPTLIFSFQIKESRLYKSRCFALKTTTPKKYEDLFYYPFGNVYPDGNICWGENYFGEVPSMKDLDIIVSTFFGSPTNNDLYNPSHLENAPYTNLLRAFLEELNGKKRFPESILKKCGNYIPPNEIRL